MGKLPNNKWGRLIENNKFLRDEKYYKNNYWSWAAWDSWAAQGNAGGCGCCSAKHYNAHLRNKRHHKKYEDIGRRLCDDCVRKVEKIIDYRL